MLKLRNKLKNYFGSTDLSSQSQMRERIERKYCRIMGGKSKAALFPSHDDDEDIIEYYVVLYHDDFDGLLSASFFGLRAVPAMRLDDRYVAYYPIDYRKTVDLAAIEKLIREKKKLENFRMNLIFLDFNVASPNNLKNFDRNKYPVFMVIDHHSAHPSGFLTSNVVIHDAGKYSCTELVCESFPTPNKLEKAKVVNALIHAVRVVDSGGQFHGYDELYKQMTNEPGCFSMLPLVGDLEPTEALQLMVDYITGTLSRDEKRLITQMKEKAQKTFTEEVRPFKIIEAPGKPTVVWYKFRNNETEHFLYASACLRAATSLDGDIFFMVLLPDKTTKNNSSFKVSVRSRLLNVKVHEFCKSYGGGGRPTRAGAYFITFKKPADFEEHIEEATARIVNGDFFEERRKDVRR